MIFDNLALIVYSKNTIISFEYADFWQETSKNFKNQADATFETEISFFVFLHCA